MTGWVWPAQHRSRWGPPVGDQAGLWGIQVSLAEGWAGPGLVGGVAARQPSRSLSLPAAVSARSAPGCYGWNGKQKACPACVAELENEVGRRGRHPHPAPAAPTAGGGRGTQAKTDGGTEQVDGQPPSGPNHMPPHRTSACCLESRPNCRSLLPPPVPRKLKSPRMCQLRGRWASAAGQLVPACSLPPICTPGEHPGPWLGQQGPVPCCLRGSTVGQI